MNRYPLWKYLVLLIALAIGGLYALPNLYGEDPALQISTARGEIPSQSVQMQALEYLEAEGVPVRGAGTETGQFLIRFNNLDDQLAASDMLRGRLDGHIVALNLAPATPEWLRRLNANPMFLGLDLRGGVHFTMEVDLAAAVGQQIDRHVNDFRTQLRENRVRYGGIERVGDHVALRFAQAPEREQALRILRSAYPELDFAQAERDGQFWLTATISDESLRELRQYEVQQIITRSEEVP